MFVIGISSHNLAITNLYITKFLKKFNIPDENICRLKLNVENMQNIFEYIEKKNNKLIFIEGIDIFKISEKKIFYNIKIFIDRISNEYMRKDRDVVDLIVYIDGNFMISIDLLISYIEKKKELEKIKKINIL